jgi:hypothetical protein
MTQAELNKNAVKSIFAIDDAKAQLESFGSQLDLGLPPEEDFEPKGFDELMTVNPSTDPNYGDSSEKFADLGDDLQDEQTQKFVIDKFAEEAAKRPGTTITAADITDICGAVQCAQLAQGGSIIKGDLVGFIKDTIAKAKNAQQSQNVSDAQPNGTVADDIAPAAGEDAAAPVEDPNAVGGPAPTMEPLEPTVEPTEPSLEPNVDDGLGADPLAADDGLGALDTGIEDAGAADGLGADLGVEDKPAPEDGAAELDAGGLDGLDDLDKDLGDIDAEEDLGLEADAAPAEGGDAAPAEGESKDEPKDEPKADESKDDGKDESKDDKKDDKKEEKDDDFDFEAVAKKAQALTEGEAGAATEVTEPAAAAEETAKEEAIPEGEATVTEGDATVTDDAVTEEAGADAGTDVQVNEECGAAKAGAKADEQIVQEGFNAEDAEAKVEAIAKEFRSNRIAEKVQAQIEAYEAKEKKAKTIAQIESVMSNFVKTEKSRDQKAQVESIVANFAQASKAAAEKAQLEAEAAKTSELKGKLDSILESVEVKEKAEPVVESVTAAPEKKSDAVGETIAMVEAAMAQMNADEDAAKAKLESIVSDATKRSEGDNLQKELDAIVESVRNA